MDPGRETTRRLCVNLLPGPEGGFVLGTSPAATNQATRATLVATVTTLPDGGLASLADSGLEGVEWLEVRGDLVGDLDPAGLRFFPGKLLYTLRSRVDGGAFEGSPERRNRRLIEAGARYDLGCLRPASDLSPEVPV